MVGNTEKTITSQEASIDVTSTGGNNGGPPQTCKINCDNVLNSNITSKLETLFKNEPTAGNRNSSWKHNEVDALL